MELKIKKSKSIIILFTLVVLVVFVGCTNSIENSSTSTKEVKETVDIHWKEIKINVLDVSKIPKEIGDTKSSYSSITHSVTLSVYGEPSDNFYTEEIFGLFEIYDSEGNICSSRNLLKGGGIDILVMGKTEVMFPIYCPNSDSSSLKLIFRGSDNEYLDDVVGKFDIMANKLQGEDLQLIQEHMNEYKELEQEQEKKEREEELEETKKISENLKKINLNEIEQKNEITENELLNEIYNIFDIVSPGGIMFSKDENGNDIALIFYYGTKNENPLFYEEEGELYLKDSNKNYLDDMIEYIYQRKPSITGMVLGLAPSQNSQDLVGSVVIKKEDYENKIKSNEIFNLNDLDTQGEFSNIQ